MYIEFVLRTSYILEFSNCCRGDMTSCSQTLTLLLALLWFTYTFGILDHLKGFKLKD